MKGQDVVVFRFPDMAKVARRIPKEKLYQHGKPGDKLKQLVVTQLDRIVWQYKLAPETINLPASPDLLEIQVLDLVLKEGVGKLDETVLLLLCKTISHPIYCRIQAGNRLQSVMAYTVSTMDQDGKNKATVQMFYSPWLAIDKAESLSQQLPVCTSLTNLYEVLLRSLIREPARSEESLAAQIGRLQQIKTLKRKITTLASGIGREKQFNRKVQLNAQLRNLQEQLQALGN